MTDDRRAHDHTIGHLGHGPGLLRARNAEAHKDRHLGLRPQPLHPLDQPGRQVRAGPGHPGHRHAVKKASGLSGNRLGPLRRRGGRDESDQRQARLPAGRIEQVRFLDRQVGHHEARQPRRLCIGHEAVNAAAIDQRVARHGENRHLHPLRRQPGDFKQPLEREAGGQSTRVGRLDHRTVGNRVAIGHAQFTERGAGPIERLEHGKRRLHVGIAGRHERSERGAALCFERRENIGKLRHFRRTGGHGTGGHGSIPRD